MNNNQGQFGSVNLDEEFPILKKKIKENRLVYLDNAATSLTPKRVTDEIIRYYHEYNANIHRGVHTLSQKATHSFESVRNQIKEFIKAKEEEEIIFTSGTTDSINLVAHTYGLDHLKNGDEIIVSHMEHHSNLVPWHLIAKKKGLIINAVKMNSLGELDLNHYKSLLNEKTKLITFASISNTLGTVNSVKEIIDLARSKTPQAVILVDGAQSIGHQSINVEELDIDFLAFSGHKIFGPTGIGVLYGKKEILNRMPPYRGGGSMITNVNVDHSNYLKTPHRFEAGTLPIAQVIGLGKAIEFILDCGWENIQSWEDQLLGYLKERFQEIPYINVIGNASNKIPIFSFTVDQIHPHDIGTILDDNGVAVRTGHHCTEPIMKHFNIPATVRASFSIYNTKEDVDVLIAGITKAKNIFG